MTTFDQRDELQGAQFVDADLRGARFVRSDLTGVRMRAVDMGGADLDCPWLFEEGSILLVNGVDVVPLVDAELNRRFPGRETRRADTPQALRTAWGAIERTWAVTLDRVAAMAPGTVDVSVDGEWSFAQTLRHLVMATDTWLRRAVLEIDDPYHPIGQPHAEYATDGYDLAVFSRPLPSWHEVLAVRAERLTMVRSFLVDVSPSDLEEQRTHPWAPGHSTTVLACLHTIFQEEWEHHRYAVRDLDSIERGDSGRR